MADVLLVTCSELPEGEPGGKLLVEELAAQGIAARWVAWDDPAVAWDAARLVAVRSAWDYDQRRDEFLAWARSVGPALMNGAEVFAWNTDKAYLVHLRQTDLPVVPTLAVDRLDQLAPVVADFPAAVVKPRVGAGGRGVVVLDREQARHGLDVDAVGTGPWVVQPLVSSVRTEGETSVFVLGGHVVSQVRKLPAQSSDGTEIRVHEEFGGSTVAVPVTAEAAQLATDTVRVAEDLVGARLPYARVDLMRMPAEYGGALAVSELEVTEPGLYLDVVPANADCFAAVVAEMLTQADPDQP
jgi:glutathione synthase/RimK-type ligase-like ATP-grasp enzyme